VLLAAILLSCAHTGRGANGGDEPALTDHFALVGGKIVGGPTADLEIRDGLIVAVGDVDPDAERVDVSGRWIAPAFIDSHVHLAYLPAVDQMIAGGVVAGVDLAAPLEFLNTDSGSFQILHAGPMITAVGGYPTQSWGRNGYGLEIATAQEATAAVDDLHGRGARLIKLPLAGVQVLDAEVLTTAAQRAHDHGMKVASHALGDEEAALAASVGADALAHTPTGALVDSTVEVWSSGAVISTLSAFGGRDEAVDNLRRLREAGATVLYGTDFGNTRTAGIDPAEIALLVDAGLDGAAILAAGTSSPAAYWGFDDLGAVEVGRAASLLILTADPLQDPAALATAETVYIAGRAQ